MHHIGFILWMVLYPIGFSITSFLGAKQRKIEGKKPLNAESNAFNALINIIIWAIIGKELFDCQ